MNPATTPPARLADLIAEITAERASLTARITQLDTALDALTAAADALGLDASATASPVTLTPAVDTPPGRPVTIPTPLPDHPWRPAPGPADPAADLACPECGQLCATRNGLGVHRKRKHGIPRDTAAYQRERRARLRGEAATPAATPARVTPINVNGAPPDPIVQAHELGLRCDDCGYVVPTDRHAMLTTHCITTHKRNATRVERTPRRASDLTPAEAS